MNLRDLKYLVALADHRHFGRAAEACFVSQPTLSTQVRKLEEELGVALVERAPRRVMLTPVGIEIAERARKVIADVEQMAEIARRSMDPEAGTVRLGLFPTLAPYLLPHVLPAIRRKFPRLELLLVEEKTDQVLARLRDGRLDAGVLALPLHDVQLLVVQRQRQQCRVELAGVQALQQHGRLFLDEQQLQPRDRSRGQPDR